MKEISVEKFEMGLLSITNYYDGPISGTCSIEGKRYYFHIYGSRYHLFELSEREWMIEDEMNVDFCDYVGNHWTYENGKKVEENCLPGETHHLFYDKWRDYNGPNLNNRKPSLVTQKL